MPIECGSEDNFTNCSLTKKNFSRWLCQCRINLKMNMNKKQTVALKMKLASLGIKIMDAKATNKPTQKLQAAFDALLAKLIANQK